MDKVVDEVINSLVESCMQNPALANRREELETYFNQMMVKTLMDQLNAEQFNQIKDLDLNSEETLDKLQLFAIQIPNFAGILDEKLGREAESIRTSGQIPS